MKTTLKPSCLLMVLLIIPTHNQADILDAEAAYNEQNYPSALQQYLDLAHLGNHQARYNLAVMYMQGQGTQTDLYKAYGWSSLVDYSLNAEWQYLPNLIAAEFDTEQLAQAKATAKDLEELYGDERIYAKLAPITYVPHGGQKHESEFTLEMIKRSPPRFPKQLILNGSQGWVRVQFEIYPDGSVRNPFVVESVPEGVFDEVSIEAIQRFKLKPEFKPGVEPYPVYATQTFQFAMGGQDSKSVDKLYAKRLNELHSLAKQGHPDAQYLYAVAASDHSVISDHLKIKPEVMNQWLLKAAQNGNLDAQFLLGKNILTGNGCQIEKQKGTDWIVHAAEQGHAKAARHAFHQLTRYNHLNNTKHPPQYWLQKAADGGDPEAQLDYANYLANTGEVNNIPIARKYLASYLEARDKSVKYYQTSAQLYSLEDRPTKAKKDQKKAEKMAKKLGWEI